MIADIETLVQRQAFKERRQTTDLAQSDLSCCSLVFSPWGTFRSLSTFFHIYFKYCYRYFQSYSVHRSHLSKSVFEHKQCQPLSDLGINTYQIQSLQEDLGINTYQIQSLLEDLGTNTYQIQSLQEDLGTNTYQIQSLQEDLGTNTYQIQSLQEDMNIFKRIGH